MRKSLAARGAGLSLTGRGHLVTIAAVILEIEHDKSPDFVAATCNKVNVLPAELMSKGGFGELFFSWTCCPAKQRGESSSRYSGGSPAAATGYSGAESESVMQTARYASCPREQQLASPYLLEAIEPTVLLSATSEPRGLWRLTVGRKTGGAGLVLAAE
jgi:hypothetical protein